MAAPRITSCIKWWNNRRFAIFNIHQYQLVGGFNPSEKHESNWESSLNRGEKKKCLKPPGSEATLQDISVLPPNSNIFFWQNYE